MTRWGRGWWGLHVKWAMGGGRGTARRPPRRGDALGEPSRVTEESGRAGAGEMRQVSTKQRLST